MTMALVAVGVVVGRVLLPSFSGCCSCLVLKRRMGGYSSCLLKSEHYDRKATKYWNDFYKRHHNKFFKDRHCLEKEWGQYFSTPTPTTTTMDSTVVQSSKVVLEVGCGAGNTLFPLLDAFPNLFIHACDFSPNAISVVKSNEDFREDQVNAFVCDLTKDDLCQRITPSSVDVVTLIFTLSAVSPEKMPLVLQNLKSVLKPSGYVLFRDYAIGDFSQEKLIDKNQMLSENFCVRGDGTCAFYFSEDFLSSLFRKEGFNTTEINVYCKEIVNRSRNITMHRRWMRGVFCYQDPSDTRHNFIPKPRSDLVVVD